MPRGSETQIALDLLPERRLPPVHFELVRFEYGHGHGGIGSNGIICRCVFGTQLESAFLTFPRRGQAVHFKTQVRQDIVIDDVVEKYGIRVEGFLRQDYAIIKRFVVVANGSAPTYRPPDGRLPISNFMPLDRISL
jgi:hypothetical protein